jgi:hypothetical protein
MRKLIFISLMSLCFLGCPNHNTDKTDASVQDVEVEPVVEVSAPQTVNGDSWQLVLPPDWKQQPDVLKHVVLIAEHPTVEAMVLLSKESYSGSFDEFAIETIRGFRGQGVTINSTSSTVINDTPFVFVQSESSDIVNNSWLTVKDGFGYSLGCGGVKTSSDQFTEECMEIANSFTVK